MIFLDSDVMIEILNISSKRGDKAIQILDKEPQDSIVINAIAYEEVLFGIFKKLKIEQLPLNHPLLRFPVIEFSKQDAELAAKIEVEMEKNGIKKPRADVLIASCVINRNSRLFTFNTKHYLDIPNVKLIE